MDRERTPESERARRSLPRNRTGREHTPERERERVKHSPPSQFIRRPAWEEEHSRIHRHPPRERTRHHSDEETEERSTTKSTAKASHKTSKRAASVSTVEEPPEVKKTKHSSEGDLKKKPSKTQKKEEKPAKVSESPPEVPLPQVVQEESSSVNHMPIHEDISPQKEEVTTMDDTEVDEISDVVDSSFLLGTLEEEELDYDENMDDLDLHPTGTLDDGDGLTVPTEEMAPKGREERNSHRKRKKSRREDSNSESGSDASDSGSESELQNKRKRRKSTHNSLSSSDHEGGSTPIRSPIRVSPSHKEPRLVREAHSSKYSRSDSSKLSVKERLYVSKRTIEEKKRMIQYQDEPLSSLRPSLANRLGPSPYGRKRSFIDFPRHGSRGTGRGPKGDAFEIAEAYKRKKRQEMLREEDVIKAKNIAKIINEPDSKPATKKVKSREEEGEKERALDKRIDEIKEQNKAIMKRKSEIEMDKELYA